MLNRVPGRNEGCGAPAAPLLGRTDKEVGMRKMIVTCAGAAALFAAAAFAPPLAQAMTIAAPAGLAKAAQAATLTEEVAYICRGGWRWRRCGWTPGYAYFRPYYYRPAYSAYAYRPYYYRPYAFYRPYYRPYAYYRPYYRPAFAAYAYCPRAYYRPYRPWWGWGYRRGW